MIEFELNGSKVQVDVPPDTPLLWVLREELELTGTKFGCGKALCGSCTIHINGSATRSCVMPISAVSGSSITTIEGIQQNDLHPVQKAWVRNNVPQCGYCQSGQIMQAISLIENSEKITENQLLEGINGNLCRCGTYNKIKTALIEAAEEMGRI
ncbi:MAG: (2Fe-2S)-binding protein [Bdellovibrionaceae bacterium]|nr:(2Fe-2S)-binding protein [Pseudobdellovibrionaceae bacterium]|tara:strand:- start:11706 stop:12167 length:462 start_codon:yes stop_codon:yes gene_type:complete